MVVDSVLEKIPSEDLAVHVVWTPVLQADDFESARQAASLIPDPRAIHYWDEDQSLGLAYGRELELPRGRELAWDIYFAYAAGVEWGEHVPPPGDWAHQLGRDERHLGDGSGLRAAVEALLQEIEPEGTRRLRDLIGP